MDPSRLPKVFRSLPGLGRPLAYHPARNLDRWGSLMLLLAFLTGAAAACSYGGYQAYLGTQTYGPAVIDDRLAVPLGLAAGLSLLALLGAWLVLAAWRRAAVVYEGGFALRDLRGVRLWRWADVDELRLAVTRHYAIGIYTGTTHAYVILDHRHTRLAFTDAYARVEELGRAIEENTFPILYPRAAAAYNAGETLVFGPVSLTKTSLQVGRKEFPWSEIDQVSVRRGILAVSRKDGGWFSGSSTSVAAVPNLRVLLSVIDQIVGIKTA